MIRQHKGYFVVELYDDKTKRKFHVRPADYDLPTPTTEEEARELEALAKLWGAASSGPMSVRKYADQFCERKFNHAGHEITQQTNDFYKGRLKRFVEEFGPRPMPSIQPAEAIHFATNPDTRTSAREVKAMFASALREQVIKTNPFDAVTVPQRKGGGKAFLRADDVAALADAALQVHGDWGHVFRAWILWTAWLGLRPSEGAGSQWHHYDEPWQLYTVEFQFHGKAGKLLPPKHNSTGTVHVFGDAARAVADLPRDNADGFMFVGKRGKPMSASAITNAFTPVKNLAGLPEASPGALRHFLASYMLNELGLPPYTIAQQLRHSDGGRLVVKTYGHPDRAIHLSRIAQAEAAGGFVGGRETDEAAI